jgi:ribokinase
VSQPRISVVGSYGVGLTFGTARAPAAGETVTGRYFRTDHGGKGSNQAVAAARLGARVRLRTALGGDSFAAGARELWAAEGITASPVTCPAEATMAGAIIVDDRGENRIVIAPGALDGFRPEHVTAADVDGADVLLVQLEIPLPTALRALRLAASAGVRSILNPAPAPDGPLVPDLLAAANIITPNLNEARLLLSALTPAGPAAGGPGPGGEGEVDREPADAAADDCAAMAARLAERAGAVVVLTAGARGAYLADGGPVRHVPAPVVTDVVDTTGAGDAFNAGLAVALAEGADLDGAARFATRAAAYCVRAAGVIPGLPRRADLRSGTGREG